MKFRQKPNGMWLVDYEENGKRRRVSTGIKTPPQRHPTPEVKAAAREIVLGIRPSPGATQTPHKAHKGDGRLTMSDLFDKAEKTVWHPDQVRAQASVRSNLKVLREMIGDVAVADVSYTRLEQLVSDMKDRGYQPSTIKRKLSMVGKALRMATMWTDDNGQPLLTSKPPLPQIVVNNLKDRVISRDEEAAIWAAIEKRRQTEPTRQWFRFRALMRLLFDTGGRLGEALTLGPTNVSSQTDYRHRVYTYVTFPRYRTKSGKPRTLPLPETSVAELDALRAHLVLVGDEWRYFGFQPNLAQRMFRQIKEDILKDTGMDLDGVTIHTIRHTTLTRLAQGGMSLGLLQLWAGHSDPKITAERYLHLQPNDLLGGLAILGTGGATSERYSVSPDNVSNTLPRTNGANAGTELVH